MATREQPTHSQRTASEPRRRATTQDASKQETAASLSFIANPQLAMKRTDSRTAESAVKAMLDAAKGEIKPPAHVKLRERDLPFWAGVVRARARDGFRS